MKALLIVFGILLFLNLLPVGGHVILNESGFSLKLVFGLLQFRLLPKKDKAPEEPVPESEEAYLKRRKKSDRKAEKKRIKLEKKLNKPKKAKEKQSLGVLIEKYLPLVRLASDALSDLGRLPTVHRLDMTVSFGGDAGKAALTYGKACAAIGAGLAILRRRLRIRHYRIHPEATDGSDSVRVTADAVITLTLGRIVCYLLKYLIRAVPVLIRLKNNGKADQKNESSSL